MGSRKDFNWNTNRSCSCMQLQISIEICQNMANSSIKSLHLEREENLQKVRQLVYFHKQCHLNR